MLFTKRFGKQLGFVVLMGSTIFSVSPASAQTTACKRDVACDVYVNTDVVIDPNYLINLLPGTNSVDVVQIGGVVASDNSRVSYSSNGGDRPFYDPFKERRTLNNNGNNPLGSNFSSRINFTELIGLYTERTPTTPLRVNLNSPALPSGLLGCAPTAPFTKCIAFHYGYYQRVIPDRDVNASFLRTYIQLRDSNNPQRLRVKQPAMASPTLTFLFSDLFSENLSLSEATPTEYLVVYSEQTNPLEPGLTMANWTQFPIVGGEISNVGLINNSDEVVITSNTRFLVSSEPIPLDQLTVENLPPTDPRFVPIPEVDGTLAPGETKTSIESPIPISIRVVIPFNVPGFSGTFNTAEEICGVIAGTITNWSEIGGPDLPVTRIVREDVSGTSAVLNSGFVQPVCGFSLLNEDGTVNDNPTGTDQPLSPVIRGSGSQGVLTAIASTEGAVGYADRSESAQFGFTIENGNVATFGPTGSEEIAVGVEPR